MLSGDSICNSSLWAFQDLNENLRCLPVPFQPSRSLTIKLTSLLAAAEISDPQIQPPAVVSSLGPEGLTHPRTIQRSTQYLRGVYTDSAAPLFQDFPSPSPVVLSIPNFSGQGYSFLSEFQPSPLGSLQNNTLKRKARQLWLSPNIYPLFYKSNPH